MEDDFLWRVRHKPTGLFYCSRKGRFQDQITNLSQKGSFYTSEEDAQSVLKNDTNRAAINKAQVTRYKLTTRIEEYRYSYSIARKSEFEVVKYELIEIKETT